MIVRRDNSTGSDRDIPSMPRFIIGVVVGIISVVLGLFILTEPSWLRILVVALGVIQLTVSAFQFAQIMRERTENQD